MFGAGLGVAAWLLSTAGLVTNVGEDGGKLNKAFLTSRGLVIPHQPLELGGRYGKLMFGSRAGFFDGFLWTEAPGPTELIYQQKYSLAALVPLGLAAAAALCPALDAERLKCVS